MMEGSVKPNDISLSTALLSSLPNAEGVWRDQALCWEHTSTGDILLEVYSYLIDLTCMNDCLTARTGLFFWGVLQFSEAIILETFRLLSNSF